MADNQANYTTNEEVRTRYSQLTVCQKVELLNDMHWRDIRMTWIHYSVMRYLMRKNQIRGSCQLINTSEELESQFSQLRPLEKSRVCDYVMLNLPFFKNSNNSTIG